MFRLWVFRWKGEGGEVKSGRGKGEGGKEGVGLVDRGGLDGGGCEAVVGSE